MKPSRSMTTNCLKSGRAVLVLFVVGLPLLTADEPVPRKSAPEDALPAPIPSETIHNLYRLSPRLYSGAQPEGAPAFDQLKQLGVRTIISVDGAKPDIESARKSGMRYVHLPIGYDGVPLERSRQLAKALRELPGPIFIHCHHGKHRGPAAAAFCGVAAEGWSRDKAVDWMRRAGTSLDYRGLFQSVETLPVPTMGQLNNLPIELPEVARVTTLVESMVLIDHEWDRLKEARDRKFMPELNEKITSSQTALQLTELFREMARAEETQRKGKEFLDATHEAEQRAEHLVQTLKKLASTGDAPNRERVEIAFLAVSRPCTACHKKFRDVRDE